MRFKKIEFVDYRQFFGSQSISLGSGETYNITLIHGANGAGKTHLFEGINWCLYGDYIENRGSIVSKERALSKDFDQEVECSVSIWYSHENREFYVSRKGRAKKVKYIPTGLPEPEEAEAIQKYRGFKLEMLPVKDGDFKVFELTTGGMKEVSDPSITIERGLPRNAKQYFLFDGERIEQLAKPDHDEEVREAVRNVLQLPSIERAIEHLKAFKIDFLTQARRASRKYTEEDLFRKIEDIDKAIDDSTREYQEHEDKLAQVGKLKTKIENDLRKFTSIKELIRRRDDLQQNYLSAQSRAKNNRNALADILGNSHILMCNELLTNASKFIEERAEKGQIPPGIRETFIKDLIERGKCICGNSLLQGSSGRQTIEAFLTNSKVGTRIAEELNDVRSDINRIKYTRSEFAGNFKNYLSEFLKSMDEMDTIGAKLEDVHNEIKNVGEADISKLEKARKDCEDDGRRLSKDLTLVELKIREFQKTKKELEVELKKVAKVKGAAGEAARLSKLCDMSIQVFEAVYEEFAKTKRREIEEQLRKVFYKLIWKKDQFPNANLTDDYHLELYDKYDSPAREELSAGERQILSLSFITAMAFVVGGKIPLIMDTPFGRLFKEHRVNICTEIPDLTNQWILLVQDEEMNPEMYAIMKPRLGGQYNLSFADGCTSIVEV